MPLARVLTIAGSDSSGGAGIQADLKAIAALGGHGMSVVTALTAQNTIGVQGVQPTPLDFVETQFRSVVDDIGLDGVKTGMLHSPELAERVADLLKPIKVPIVVDPVMVAKGGDRLLSGQAVASLKEKLIPQASLITPNLDEAEELLGRPVRNQEQMIQAARDLVGLGAKAALVKGGHLEDDPCDVLFDGREIHQFRAKRINTIHTHGTGCTLASACAVLLAQGWELPAAVERARILVRRAILGGLPMGQGHGPVHAMADLGPRLALKDAMEEMRNALQRMEDVPGLARMIPEIRGQLGYALPGAVSPQDVLAVAGRITHLGDRLKAAGPPWPGASSHVAKIVLTAISFDPHKRAAMALCYDPRILEKGRELGLSIGEFSRADEPQDLKEREGSTLEWGTHKVISEMGQVPDLIFDRGEVGKEPVIRLLAANPAKIVDKLLALAGKDR